MKNLSQHRSDAGGMLMKCVRKDLTAVSKEGKWGKGGPFDESVERLAIRGTDFEDVRFGSTATTPCGTLIITSRMPSLPSRRVPRSTAYLLSAQSFRLIYKVYPQIQNRRRTRDLLLPRLLSGRINLKSN